MSEIIKVKYSGQTCIIKGPGIKTQEIKEGSIIDMPKSVYDNEFQKDTRFTEAVSRSNVSRETNSEKQDGGHANKKMQSTARSFIMRI